MPASSAASTIPIPAGTCSSRSSIVTVTSSGVLNPLPPSRLPGTEPAEVSLRRRSTRHLCRRLMMMLVDGRENPLQRRLAAEWAPALVDVPLELLAEALDVLDHRAGGKVAERAQAPPHDAVADVEEQVELGLLGAAVLQLLEELRYPTRSLATRGALPARLVHVELRRSQRELHHAGPVVDHDHRRSTELRPGFCNGVVVEVRLQLIRRHHRRRRAARDDRLQFAPAGHAATDVVDQLPQRRAELELVVARPLDVPGQREDDGAG